MLDKFEGIVLFKRDHKEHDALVKIFTEKFGTKMFYIKGLNKGNHSLSAQMIPLTYNQYVGTIHKDGLSFIKEASTKQAFRQLQMDFKRQAYAVYISQLFDAAIDDNVPHPYLFQVLSQSLAKINEGISPEIITTYVELHLLEHFGISLNFQHCVKCKNQTGPFDFSINLGGLLCQQHFFEDPYRLHISAKSVHVACMLANMKLEQMNQVNLSSTTLKDLRRLMDEIYQEYVGIHLRGKSYLEKLDSFEENMPCKK